MIMRLWVGNDVNPSCLSDSPPPAHQSIRDVQKVEMPLLPQINIIRKISKHINEEFGGGYSSMPRCRSGPRRKWWRWALSFCKGAWAHWEQ